MAIWSRLVSLAMWCPRRCITQSHFRTFFRNSQTRVQNCATRVSERFQNRFTAHRSLLKYNRESNFRTFFRISQNAFAELHNTRFQNCEHSVSELRKPVFRIVKYEGLSRSAAMGERARTTSHRVRHPGLGYCVWDVFLRGSGRTADTRRSAF